MAGCKSSPDEPTHGRCLLEVRTKHLYPERVRSPLLPLHNAGSKALTFVEGFLLLEPVFCFAPSVIHAGHPQVTTPAPALTLSSLHPYTVAPRPFCTRLQIKLFVNYSQSEPLKFLVTGLQPPTVLPQEEGSRRSRSPLVAVRKQLVLSQRDQKDSTVTTSQTESYTGTSRLWSPGIRTRYC